jgi:hypothetical protein
MLAVVVSRVGWFVPERVDVYELNFYRYYPPTVVWLVFRFAGCFLVRFIPTTTGSDSASKPLFFLVFPF